MSMEKVKSEILKVKDDPSIFTRLCELYYDTNSDLERSVVSEALANLHNSNELNFLEIMNRITNDLLPPHKFYILHRIFDQTLPLINADIADVLQCLDYLATQVEEPFAVRGISNAFIEFCGADDTRADKSVQLILEKDKSTYYSFLASSILAIHSRNPEGALQTISELINHENIKIRNQIYLVLQSLDADDEQTEVLWHLLVQSSKDEDHESSYTTILQAIHNFGLKHPEYWSQIALLLEEFLLHESLDMQYQISHLLAFRHSNVPNEILMLYLGQLRKAPLDDANIINNVDHILEFLAEQELNSQLIELLELFLLNECKITQFDYFSRQLIDKYGSLRDTLITHWFLSNDIHLYQTVYDLVHESISINRDIEIKADISLLDTSVKQMFVCRKAIGWLFTKPVTVGSYLFSVYEHCSDDIRQDIEELIFEPMLISYSGKFKQFLESKIDSNEQVELCQRVLDRFTLYFDDLDKINSIRELKAPAKNIEAYWNDFNKGVQNAYDNTSDSFLSQICTMQRILYGNGSVYYIEDSNGQTHRSETKMAPFSYSSEFPRLEVIDPEGLDYMLRVFRYKRMKDEINS